MPDGTPALIERVGCGLHAIRENRTETVLEAQGDRERAARLTPDGHLVCVGQYGGVSVRRIGDATYARKVGTGPGATPSLGGPAAISEDGRYAAWVDRDEGDVVRMIVADTQEEEIVSVPGTSFIGRIRDDGALVVIDVDAGTTVGELRLPITRAPSAVAPWQATGITGVAATGELLTATPENTVSRWAMNEAAWLDLACRSAARDLTAEEWRQVTDYDLPADLRCRR
ncbi:hypothetical protein AB0K14_07450 [Actinosynnema sp. NPDC050801]|uniref:hypothetical protein n=1 Tax=unclassified Actinosynnema TaxID=2637065 RepID=UPI0033C15180